MGSRIGDVNKLIRVFIVSETLLWSGWNLFFPIIALFVVSRIKGGNVEIAATAFSVYLIFRVFFELILSKYFSATTLRKKVWFVAGGQIILSFAYLGFIFSHTILHLFLMYGLLGAGLGLSSPSKLAIFSTHLDKNKESKEWSYSDATTLVGCAAAGVIGGYVAKEWGFDAVFVAASFVNFLSVLPYFFFFRKYYT